MHIVRYPLDFSVSVNRLLDAMRPSLVVLMEGELWPNFLRECGWREIPVILVNGRVTTSAFRNYKRIKPIVTAMLEGLRGICVQGQTYADRFIELGAPPGRVLVTGTMKFDTAPVGQGVSGALPLAESVGLRVGQERIWVCGSTGPGEEQAILAVYRELLMRFPRLRLVLVPRHPERFDEVARLIEEARFRVVRRSERNRMLDPNIAIPPVVLGDTMGELRVFYSIADIVFVGRTLVDLGPRQRGSDMIEPAALSKPVIIGPWTDNFAEAVNIFLAADAMRVATDPESLAGQVAELLANPKQAEQMGRRAATIVQVERGATERNAEVILGELNLVAPPQSAAGRPIRAPFPTLEG
jgi:3-deoxy-D-manno-octulosonic-acid transferase